MVVASDGVVVEMMYVKLPHGGGWLDIILAAWTYRDLLLLMAGYIRSEHDI